MNIWAIADLHLSFGVPNKSMDLFGDNWLNHAEKIAANWKSRIAPEDLVLVAGDISWALHLQDAVPDLEWLHALPGTKMMIRGNHDYWWTSLSQVQKVLPSSIKVIQNNVIPWNDVAVGGARLWDTEEYSFNSCIEFRENQRTKKPTEEPRNPLEDKKEDQKIFQRELSRLELSLNCFKNFPGKKRLVMTHYPPIGLDLKDSQVSRLLEQFGVEICVFGHLHNVRAGEAPFGEKNGVRYLLTACDYLNFVPTLLK